LGRRVKGEYHSLRDEVVASRCDLMGSACELLAARWYAAADAPVSIAARLSLPGTVSCVT
jgi:hypothetical protein